MSPVFDSSAATQHVAEAREEHAASTQLVWEVGDVWVYTYLIYSDDNRLSNVLGMPFADDEWAKAERQRGLSNAGFIAWSHENILDLASSLESAVEYIAELERQHDRDVLIGDMTQKEFRSYSAVRAENYLLQAEVARLNAILLAPALPSNEQEK